MLRRRFVRSGLVAMGGLLLAACEGPVASGSGDSRTASRQDGRSWVMPEEGRPHKRTWMAFGASEGIWGRQLLPQVRRNLADVASVIARFEPVSMLVRSDELELARGMVGPNVELITADLDDLWMRDTGPVFVRAAGARAGVDFNFDGWGGKQEHRRDAAVAQFVTGRAGVQRIRTDLVLEGGALEVDGEGTAIITESCVLNDNRNRGWNSISTPSPPVGVASTAPPSRNQPYSEDPCQTVRLESWKPLSASSPRTESAGCASRNSPPRPGSPPR